MLTVQVGCGGETASPPATPEARFERLGRQVYGSYCITCHQPEGQGIPGSYPPLTRTAWILGDQTRLVRLLLNGMQGPVEVNGQPYNNVMTPHGFLTDEQIAAVLTYVRSHFGNDAGAVTEDEVARIRAANDREGVWDASELWQLYAP